MRKYGSLEGLLSALRGKLQRKLLTCALFGAMVPTTLAQDFIQPASQDDVLAQRLEVAEQRIESLHRLPSADDEDMIAPTSFSGYGQESVVDQSLARRVQALESAYERQMAKDAKAAAAKEFPSKPTLKVAGRIHLDNWFFPGEDDGIRAFENPSGAGAGGSVQDRWTFRRLRFGVSGDILENMLYKIEMEFAGGNDVEYRDAYMGWKELPVLQTLLLGNQKRPYGLDHLNSSRYNVFMERPFVIEAINQDARRIGVCSYGVSENEAWNWRYGVYNREKTQDDAGYVSDHFQAEVAGRLANTIWYDECSDGRGYAHWAVSGSYAQPDGTGVEPRAANTARYDTRPEARTSSRWIDTREIAGADEMSMVGLEGLVNVGAFSLVGEYQNAWVDRDPGFGDQLHFHGGYVYAAYFLTGEHTPWERDSGTLGRTKPFENFFLVNTCCDGVQGGWGAWQVAVRYSMADFSDDNVLGGEGEAVTLGLNWWWNPYSRVQFNYINGRIYNHRPVLGQTEGDYEIIGARFMVDF